MLIRLCPSPEIMCGMRYKCKLITYCTLLCIFESTIQTGGLDIPPDLGYGRLGIDYANPHDVPLAAILEKVTWTGTAIGFIAVYVTHWLRVNTSHT